MKKIIQKIVKRLSYRGYLNWLPDKPYLKLLFWGSFGYRLNLENPETFNEKLQWLKLYDRNEIYTTMVDKYAAKEYVKKIIGEKYIIPTFGVWNSFDEIDFEKLPNQFVLKCTHDCGGHVICRDKSLLDLQEVKKILEKSMKTNYYFSCREWPYKNVKPQIIAEKYIGNENGSPDDYKFWTFGGNIDSIMVCKERDSGHPWFYFYDENWKRILYQHAELEREDEVPMPSNLKEMISVVKKLAKGMKQVRIDLYNVDGAIFFGEITLFDQAGFDMDITYETDYMLGKKIEL